MLGYSNRCFYRHSYVNKIERHEEDLPQWSIKVLQNILLLIKLTSAAAEQVFELTVLMIDYVETSVMLQ